MALAVIASAYADRLNGLLNIGNGMKFLGLYCSFTSVLAVAYVLFLGMAHSIPVLLPIGAAIGIAYLTAGYLLMVGKRTGLALGVFVAAITVGVSGYFLATHYFSSSRVPTFPDLIMLAFSLLAFVISLSQSPFQHDNHRSTIQE